MTDATPTTSGPAPGGAPRRGPRPGTAAAALAHRDFRVVWAGSLGSNVGTWMQNAVLGAYGWDLTKSPTFVAMLYFAQLGPQFVLAVPGGAWADALDRRKVLIATQVLQMVFSVGLAGATALDGSARTGALVACVGVIGASNSLFLPAWSAMTAMLVGPEDLPGAVSLGFVQLNLSRVVGPFLGVVAYAAWGPASVFGVNAASYLVAIGALAAVHPPAAPHHGDAGVLARLREGFRAVRADPVLAWALRTIGLFSFFCLPFLSLLPAIAEDLYGIAPRSTSYAVLFATFGLGSALGAVAVGTMLAGRPLVRLVQGGFACFVVALGALASSSATGLAYPAVFAVGATYFVAITALSTSLQQRLDHRIRGRVMALWFMFFGGTIPIGAALAGVLADRTSLRLVLGIGAVAAGGLALTRPRARARPVAGEP